MKRPPTISIEDGWEIWRCAACNAVLCIIKPAPGLMIENECRKCGQKDVRIIPDIEDRLDKLKGDILSEVRQLLG